MSDEYILWFEDPHAISVEKTGGKNASLAEMTQTLVPRGIRVPGGFAVTVAAFHAFLDHNGLKSPIKQRLDAFDAGKAPLEQVGAEIRQLVLAAGMPEGVARAIREAYAELSR